jgi:hypothetical protein
LLHQWAAFFHHWPNALQIIPSLPQMPLSGMGKFKFDDEYYV